MKEIEDLRDQIERIYDRFGFPLVMNFALQDLCHLQFDSIAVHGYPINDLEEVVLVRHRLHGQRWLPPGGHPKEGEPFESTILREVEEETGLHCKVNRFAAQIWMQSRISGTRYILLFFKLSFLSGKIGNVDPDHDILCIRSFKELPSEHMYELDKIILSKLNFNVKFCLEKVGKDFKSFRPLVAW